MPPCDGYDHLFGDYHTGYSKADEVFNFSVDGDTVRGFSITLYAVEGGNLSTRNHRERLLADAWFSGERADAPWSNAAAPGNWLRGLEATYTERGSTTSQKPENSSLSWPNGQPLRGIHVSL